MTTTSRIFCVANQKGGVGKTTTTVNLAAGLVLAQRRVLVVDLDPQGNATMGSGIDKRALAASIYDVLIGTATIDEARQASPSGGFDVVGANRELAGAEVELVSLDQREKRLRMALGVVTGEYDFILIDCPPALSLLTLNGLCAAHGVIVPMQCEYFALEGLSDLVNTIKQVHANLNRDLQIVGLLRVMFDARITLQQQVSDQLKAHFGDKLFDSVIPRNVRLAEAPSYGQPGVTFDPSSKGAQAFVAFARELVQRLETVAGRQNNVASMTLLTMRLSRLEDATINASEPPGQRWLDGWLLRLSAGAAKRARSVHALANGVMPLDEKLAAVEAIYRRAELPLVFRVTPFTQPADLDARLHEKGFVRFGETSVMWRPCASGRAEVDPLPAGARWVDWSADRYGQEIGSLRGASPEHRRAHAARLQASPMPYLGRAILEGPDDRVLACGQLAVEDDMAGLYDLHVAVSARRQGWGQRLCHGLLREAADRGAATAYLQVDGENEAARGLYLGLGFSEGYRYHYRAQQPC